MGIRSLVYLRGARVFIPCSRRCVVSGILVSKLRRCQFRKNFTSPSFLGGSALSSSICATFRALTALRWVQFTVGLRLCPFFGRAVPWGWLRASRPALFFFFGDFGLASILLGGLWKYGSVGAEFRAFAARWSLWIVLGLH